ncbi:MAG: MFS transporter [Caulobacteraceae bacterium]
MADTQRLETIPGVGRTRRWASTKARLPLNFLVAVMLAQVGACLAFSPLLQILLPLKAAGIDPSHKGVLLSHILLAGATTAAVANLAVGVLSDRTRSRFGRRRPWMAAGLVGTLGAYLLLAKAASTVQLFVAIIAFQLLFNTFFSAFAAAVAERTPSACRGMVYSMLALGPPVGSIGGLLLVGDLAHGPFAACAELSLVVLLALAPFILLFRDSPAPPQRIAQSGEPSAPAGPWTRDFLLAVGGRVATVTAQATLQGYAFFALQDRWANLHDAPTGLRPEQALANLLIIVTGANLLTGLICGWWSDRMASRKPFVILSAVLSGLALAACGLAGDWWTVVVALIIFGCASGCYNAIGSALLVQVLPSLNHAGRDFGLANLGNTLPQALAPLVAALVMHNHPSAYRTLFLLAGVLAASGGLAILPVKSSR